jgi:site-specific recombinase XerD
MNQQAEKYLSTLDRLPRTLETYRWALDYYFRIAGENLSDEAYKKFLDAIRDLSPSSKRVVTSAVMGMYAYWEIGDLARRKKLNEHYMRKVKTKPVNFDRDAVETILTHCESLHGNLIQLRDRAFVLTLADTGFRISELNALTRGEIDWQEERVLITGKGDKAAVVRLSHRCVAALKEYLAARAQLDGESGKPLGSLPLFAQHGKTKKIKPMSIDGMRKAIKERMKEAGARVRIHDFRHYFVTTIVIASNGNLKKAQELARHESTQTTQRYAHFTQTELDQTYDEIFNRTPVQQ